MKNMKGGENQGFDPEESSSQDKTKDGIEMNEHSSKKDTLVTLDNPKAEPKAMENPESPQPPGNFIVKWNLRARNFLKKLMFGKGWMTRIFWLVLINGAALAVLVASINQHVSRGTSEIDWCNGVGLLWVIFCIVYIIILYNLANKYFRQSVRSCLKPLVDYFTRLAAKKGIRWTAYWIPIIGLAVFVVTNPGKSGRRIISFLGMVVFVILGYLFSKHPAHVNWRPVICGMILQFIFGLLTIQLEVGKNILDCFGKKVTAFLKYADAGSAFVFNFLAKPEDGADPVFAFSVLPVIYFLGFVINILSYYGALQWLIMSVSNIVRLGMGTTVCESVNATASIFLGMTEAPLLIQKYLKDLTKSEICSILCAGWSTVAGAVMAAYIQFGVNASHLIAASVMSAPASLSYSKLIYPETEKSRTTVDNIVLHKEEGTNFLDAATKGALGGILIVGSIIANIIAFLGFIAFLDGMCIWLGAVTGFEQLSFQFIVSKIFYPVSFLLGVDVESLEDVAYLIGIKTVANEFQAFKKLGELIEANKISERSEIIATYALCGFSNFGSIGITIGTLSVMEPKQASAVTEVALPAFIAANIVCFLTACVAGCLID